MNLDRKEQMKDSLHLLYLVMSPTPVYFIVNLCSIMYKTANQSNHFSENRTGYLNLTAAGFPFTSAGVQVRPVTAFTAASANP